MWEENFKEWIVSGKMDNLPHWRVKAWTYGQAVSFSEGGKSGGWYPLPGVDCLWQSWLQCCEHTLPITNVATRRDSERPGTGHLFSCPLSFHLSFALGWKLDERLAVVPSWLENSFQNINANWRPQSETTSEGHRGGNRGTGPASQCPWQTEVWARAQNETLC